MVSSTVTLARLPPDPLKVTVPPKLFPVYATAIEFVVAAVKVELPVIAKTPLLLILPAVAVAFRLPPTVDAARLSPLAFTTVALLFVPVVANATVPLTFRPSTVILLVSARVAKLALRVTVTVPTSVIAPPAVTLRSRATENPVGRAMAAASK